MRVIHFYRTGDEYGFLSNFSRHPIYRGGESWLTVEHYFQAMKFEGTPHYDEIRQAKSPMVAARMGRSRERPLRTDWEDIKDAIMHDAVLTKFMQHPIIRVHLINTGDATLVEHTSNDSYWGDGGDGSGLNKLGLILMQVRDKIRKFND
jgi:N-glycosidase YbiA